jgi:hypothetical protein
VRLTAQATRRPDTARDTDHLSDERLPTPKEWLIRMLGASKESAR